MRVRFEKGRGPEKSQKRLDMASSGWYDGVDFQRERHHFSTIVDISVDKYIRPA